MYKITKTLNIKPVKNVLSLTPFCFQKKGSVTTNNISADTPKIKINELINLSPIWDEEKYLIKVTNQAINKADKDIRNPVKKAIPILIDSFLLMLTLLYHLPYFQYFWDFPTAPARGKFYLSGTNK